MKYALCICALLLALPYGAHAATLTFNAPVRVNAGNTFSVPILLSTQGNESANTIVTTITFPSSLLALLSVSRTTSIVTLWPQSLNIATTSVQMTGIVLNPGWSGNKGVVATLLFQAKANGVAHLIFTHSAVLANDGMGTLILSSTTPAVISISAAPTSSSKPPLSTQKNIKGNTKGTILDAASTYIGYDEKVSVIKVLKQTVLSTFANFFNRLKQSIDAGKK